MTVDILMTGIVGISALTAWHLYNSSKGKRCPACKKKMILTVSKTNQRKIWCCSQWRKCKTYIDYYTEDRIPAVEVERTGGRKAL